MLFSHLDREKFSKNQMEILTNYEVVVISSVLGNLLGHIPEDSFYWKYLVTLYKIIRVESLRFKAEKCIRKREEMEQIIEIVKKYKKELHKAGLDQWKMICKEEENLLRDDLEGLYSKIDEEVLVSKQIRKYYRRKSQDLTTKFKNLKERREWKEKILGQRSNFEEVLPSIRGEVTELVDLGTEGSMEIVELLDEIEYLENQKISDFLIDKSKGAHYLDFLIKKKKISKDEALKILERKLPVKKKKTKKKGLKGKKTGKKIPRKRTELNKFHGNQK